MLSPTIMDENSQDDILLLPRKKISVKRLKIGGQKSRSWFIDERKGELETRLEKPTAETKQALTSGLRSAIIRDEDGRYIKLKGVAPRTYLAQGHHRGFCRSDEAANEIANIINLKIKGYPFLPYDVGFVERMPLSYWSTMKPGTSERLAEIFMGNLSNNERRAKLYKLMILELDACSADGGKNRTDDFSNNIKTAEPEMKDFFSDKHLLECFFCYIPAYYVKGDTRLDEMIFHLTKKEYSGKERTSRDAILTNLCLQAGAVKAVLHQVKWVWSQRENFTNNHIGNFVVYPREGNMSIGIVDLDAADPYDEFFGEKSKSNLVRKGAIEARLKQDLESLQKDFFDPVTCSLPTMPRYRNFPEYLKKRCAKALEIGFEEGIKESFLKEQVIHIPASLEINRGFWPEQEFKYELNRLLK